MQINANTLPAPDSSKESLLRSATVLFSQKGFDGVSVKEIANRANVNVGLINYYFGGKSGIYQACLSSVGEQGLASARRILTPARSAMEVEIRLQLFAEDLIETYLKNPEATILVYREFERPSPEMEKLFRGTFMFIFETLLEFIKNAKKLQLIRSDLDPEMIAFLFLGQIANARIQDQTTLHFFGKSLGITAHRNQFIHHLVEVFIRGISSSTPKEGVNQ